MASNQILTSTPNANNVYRPSDILRQFSSTPIPQSDDAGGDRPLMVASPVVRRHLRRSANANGPHFECGYCTQTFKLESNLMFHEQIHQLNNHQRKDRDEPFVCVVCGMRFGLKSEMDRHHADHMEKVVKWCSYCNNKKCGNKEHLQLHERIHEWINSLKEHEPFNCNESELIYQSEDVDEITTDDLPMRSNVRIKIEAQTQNDAINLQSDSKKSNDSSPITIIISSDTDSSRSDNSPTEVQKSRSKRGFVNKDEAADSTPGFELVQQNVSCDKKTFKCAYCELSFEQNVDKLTHDCLYHTPKVILTNGPIGATIDTVTMTMNADMPMKSSVPGTSQNRKKISQMKQKLIDRMKQGKKDKELKHHADEKTTDQVEVVESKIMTRARCNIILTEMNVDVIAHNIDDNTNTVENKPSTKTGNTSSKTGKKQRFTSKETLDVHLETAHETEGDTKTTQNEISPSSFEQCNQFGVPNAINEPETVESNNDTKVQSLQQKSIEKEFKCSHCDFTFAQIDEQLKHECRVHSLRIFLRKIEDDAELKGIIKTHTLETKDDEILPKNDHMENEETENCMPIESDIDVRPDNTEKRNKNKRKRSKHESDKSSNDDDSGKRTRLENNPTVIEQQFNNNSTTANDMNFNCCDVLRQKPNSGQQSKENVQQLQKKPQKQSQKRQQPQQQQQQQQQRQKENQEQQSFVGRNTRSFWKKQFLGINERQLKIISVPSPRRVTTELTLAALNDMNISD